MINEVIINPKSCILSCPFSHACSLPKVESLCNFPDYKLCHDYDSKLKRLKASTKILH